MVKMGQQTLQRPRFVAGARLITGTIPGLALTQRTGVSVFSNLCTNYAGVNNIAVDTLRAGMFLVTARLNIDRIGTYIAGPGGAGAKVRVGLYSDNGSLYPGALIVDGGELAADAIAEVLAVVDEDLDPGFCWLILNCDDNAVDILGPNLSLFLLSSTTHGMGYTVASAYGALPDPFPAGGIVSINIPNPRYRISAYY